MIVRVVRGRIRADSVNEFYRRVEKALPAVRCQDGALDVHVGRQRDDEGERFVFVSYWRDLASVYRWVGGGDLLCVPAAPGGYEDLLDDCDVQHYEEFEPTAVLSAAAPGD